MDDYTAVLERAIDEYGEECQIDKAIEEMSELTKALLKRRYVSKDYEIDILDDAIAEEIADVEIMIKQLKMIHQFEYKVLQYKKEKIERLERRLNESGRKGQADA